MLSAFGSVIGMMLSLPNMLGGIDEGLGALGIFEVYGISDMLFLLLVASWKVL